MYDEKTGKRVEVAGKPMPRPRGTLAPCRQRANGCPKGTPEASRALDERNLRAWTHYQQCRAVGQFPEDGIVARNAAIIRRAEEDAAFQLSLMMRGGNG